MCSGDNVPKIVEETLSEAPPLQLSNALSVNETIVAENEISKLKIAPPIEAVAEVNTIIPILPSHAPISTTETASPPPAPVSIPLPPFAPISSTSKKKSGTSKDTPSGATGGRGRCCSRYHKVLL